LKDIETGIAGMNHFMLPEPVLIDTFWTSDSTRFGKQAMEALLKNLLSQGASRKRLVAKVFGGAQVIKQQASGDRSIPTANINFAMTYLNLEGIKVVAQDTGGIRGRRIMFFTDSGVVYVQKLHAAQEIE
jgi:chemotaxis protein CheD